MNERILRVKNISMSLGLGAEVVEANNEQILRNEARMAANEERIDAMRRSAPEDGEQRSTLQEMEEENERLGQEND